MKDNEYITHLAKTTDTLTGITSISDEMSCTIDKLDLLKNSVEEDKKENHKKFKNINDKLSKLIKDTKGLNQANVKHEASIEKLHTKSDILAKLIEINRNNCQIDLKIIFKYIRNLTFMVTLVITAITILLMYMSYTMKDPIILFFCAVHAVVIIFLCNIYNDLKYYIDSYEKLLKK